MRRSLLERGLAAVGAAALLIVGFDGVTYAATGNSLLLGKWNMAGATTVVSNTGSGAALDLRVSSPGTPPLTVNSSAVVPQLHATNSDRLAGAGAASYQRKCAQGSVLARATVTYQTDDAWHANPGGGYVCSGGSVEVKRMGVGEYEVRFGYSTLPRRSGLTGIPVVQLNPFFCSGRRILAMMNYHSATPTTPVMNYVGVQVTDSSGIKVDCLFSLVLV